MTNTHTQRRQRGSTLLELMVAVSIFVVISTSAFLLVSKQQNASMGSIGQVGLNMGLRNTVSMLQMDLANSGSYFYQTTNLSNTALGVTMVNRVVASGSSCYTAPSGSAILGTYGANCFDTLNILDIDSTYPVVGASDTTGGSGTGNCTATTTGKMYGQAGVSNAGTANASTLTLAQTAASYKIGDQLLLLKNSGLTYTSVVLTAVPTVSGGAVLFTFNPTTSTGSNTLANDPLNITACNGNTPCPPATVTTSQFATSFCGNDWILKVAPITYQVNSTATDYSGNQDPTFTRTQNGVTSTVMDQVIGFKAGGSIWNDPYNATTNVTNYNYDASSYTLTPSTSGVNAFNFMLLRSVRVSLIGRTAPIYTKNYMYRNTFDGGPYQVQGTAVVVNPRNLNYNTSTN